MEEIVKYIKNIWDKLDLSLNEGTINMSSEKSIVFNFAWKFYNAYQSQIVSVDFETSLFKNFSDGQFLDLYMICRGANGQEVRIGIEFKFPIKKENGSNQTETRQKIINDLKRLNWLLANDKIDIGAFLCATNEKGYISIGKYRVAPNFLTHEGHVYSKDSELPTNKVYSEMVFASSAINFKWRNVKKDIKNNFEIKDGKYSFLEPILMYKQ